MAKLTNDCKRKLNEIELYRIFDAEGSGMTKHCRCPKCGAEGKKKSKYIGLDVVDDQVKNKHLVKCRSCGFGVGGGAINVMMTTFDLDFMEACRKLSDQFGMSLEFEEEKKPARSSKTQEQEASEHSFVARQLRDSGLTFEDVKASVLIDGEKCTVSPFQRGKVDILTGKVDKFADEMIILYYDLEGRRRTYRQKIGKKEIPYTRVRYSNPEAHTDKNGKAIKYQTPFGAKTELYIPQKIRSLFQNSANVDTIFIQEGEKKAEKASKHSIPSIAIQGIGNIGNKDEGLPDEIQYFVQRCSVKNIVFIMDSDWNDLSSSLKADDNVGVRPMSFARAMIKFRKYVATLAQCGINVDIWHAHVRDNEAGDKGIDDLLVNTLKGKEDELRKDIDSAMIAHDGAGIYIDCINVTSWSDSQIMNLWSLNKKDDFFSVHHDALMKLRTFKFQGVSYKVEGDKININSEVGTGVDFWKVYYDDKQNKKIDIYARHILNFLQSNGYRFLITDEGRPGFVKIDNGIISKQTEYDLRGFVMRYVMSSTKDDFVICTLTESLPSKMSASILALLEPLEVTAGEPEVYRQQFYFRNKQIAIDGSEIKVEKLVGPVWRDNLIDRQFDREQIFKTIEPDGNGSYRVELTEAGKECEFLQYIFHVSDMWKGQQKDADQLSQYYHHIVNKITCVGYLLRDYKDMNETRAVIAVDAAMSEVGTSKGRTGKSLIGKALSQFISQASINGPKLRSDDQYIFSNVSRTTKNIFIDDINLNFNIKELYQSLTGDLNVNIKQGARFVIPYDRAPKFLITSNNSITDVDDSTRARIIFMSYAPWYSADYTPVQEFGHLFFVGWDDRQWQLFDNLMCECVMYYMRSYDQGWQQVGKGAIEPPMEDISKRALRQTMGEQFLSWAELYYSIDGPNINRRKPRKEVYEAYLAEYNLKSSMLSAHSFRKRLDAYCRFTGLHLNASKKNKDGVFFEDFFITNPGESFIGDRDTSNSIEYISVTTTEFLILQELQNGTDN